jgi:isochorismate synthase
MRTFVAQALEEARAEALGDSLLVLTAAVPAVPVERFATVFAPGGLSLWDPDGLDADGWSFVGVGQALLLETRGEDRLRNLRELAEIAFTKIVERRAPDLEKVPTIRLFGGLSFVARAPDAPWAGFGEASFVLPRWLYGRKGNQAFLRIAVQAGELERSETLLGEISALMAIAESGPTAPLAGTLGQGRLDELDLQQWSTRIAAALSGIRAGAFEKVVAARRSLLTTERSIDVAALLTRMGAIYADSARFALARGNTVFLGATPERLVSRRGAVVECDALAGSRARRGSSDEDGVQALLSSEKDLREHAPVVAGIRAGLEPFSRSVSAAARPGVRTLRTVHHLWTPVTAELARPVHVLELVKALHPTPAVCGLPRGPALDWITAHEPEGRGWYAAPVGWFDAEGNGTFVVAIRSALIRGREAWLYAGGGIVEGSDPVAEYQETALKQGTMLAALGATL